MAKQKVTQVRILSREEYPPEITRADGAYRPDVRFAAIHPEGLYYVDHQGAGHFAAYFLPKRRGSRPRSVGGASSLRGALARVSAHEDELIDPSAPRETGGSGPVSVFSLGRRTAGKKPDTQLDAEIRAYLSSLGEA